MAQDPKPDTTPVISIEPQPPTAGSSATVRWTPGPYPKTLTVKFTGGGGGTVSVVVESESGATLNIPAGVVSLSITDPERVADGISTVVR